MVQPWDHPKWRVVARVAGCRSRTKAKHVGKLLVAASKGKPLGTGLF